MTSRRRRSQRFAWKSGAEEALTGLFVALVVSILIFSTPISRFGIDFSQKILLGLDIEGGALGQTPASMQDAPADWVFVDLGGRFCGSQDGGALCPPRQLRTDRTALAGLLAQVRAQKPRLIILDVATEPVGEREDAALVALLNQPGSPILLSWSPMGEDTHTQQDGQATLGYDPARFLCDPAACLFPNARYFPSLRRISGTTARWLTPEFRTVSVEGDRALIVPSISRAAAHVARAPASSPWSLIDAAANAKVPDIGCDRISPAECATAYRQTQRIFSFAPVAQGAKRTDAHAWNALTFTHYTPDPNPVPGTLPRTLGGAVVVVGDSRESARDRTWSAVGSVSGAEIILNDARQFLIAPPRPTPGLLAYIWSESPFLLMGFLAVFLVSSRLARHQSSAPTRIGQAARALGRPTAVLLLAMLTTALFYVAYLWLSGISPGAPPDIVTPFIGTMLEGFLELMHRLTTFVQLLAKRLIESVEARFRKSVP